MKTHTEAHHQQATSQHTEVTVRTLSLFEIPMLLAFKRENDYCSPIEGRAHPDTLLKALVKRIWYGERLVTLGAFNERGELIGYASVVFGIHKSFRGAAHIANIAVSEKERGKGIGTSMLGTIETLARSRGLRRIELEVFASNQGSIRLYERLGYETEGVKKRFIENSVGSDDLVLMAKLLE